MSSEKIQQTDFIPVLLKAYALALTNMTFKWKVKKKQTQPKSLKM